MTNGRLSIQLFNPPVHHYAGLRYLLNPTLGLPIIAAVLRREGYEVGVYDLDALGVTPEVLASRFDERISDGTPYDNAPDAVGFTCLTQSKRGVLDCVGALRGCGYAGHIVVGGPGVSVPGSDVPHEMLDVGADCVVIGECEGNVERVFAERESGIMPGEPMPIDEIPSPLWEVHRPAPTRYRGNQPKLGHPEGIAMWSRGCPHRCIFCGNPVFGGRRTWLRSPELVRMDMAALRDLGVRSAFVYDDELVCGEARQQEWLVEACREVAPLGLTWKCQGRCSRRLEPETLAAMRAGGCRAIMWGVESFSNKVLTDMRKGTTEEDIWRSLRLARGAGIRNWIFLMVGNYRETADDLAYTERRLRKACAEDLVQWAQVTVCTPEPGTELWRLAEEGGWLMPPPEDGPQMNQVYAPTPWLSKNELGRWQRRLRDIAR